MTKRQKLTRWWHGGVPWSDSVIVRRPMRRRLAQAFWQGGSQRLTRAPHQLIRDQLVTACPWLKTGILLPARTSSRSEDCSSQAGHLCSSWSRSSATVIQCIGFSMAVSVAGVLSRAAIQFRAISRSAVIRMLAPEPWLVALDGGIAAAVAGAN
jgi:hypothetical protein